MKQNEKCLRIKEEEYRNEGLKQKEKGDRFRAGYLPAESVWVSDTEVV